MPFPIAGDLPDPEIELASPGLLYWQADSLPLSHLGRDMKHPLMICPSLIYNDVKNWVKGIRNSLVYCLSSISNFNKYFYILLFLCFHIFRFFPFGNILICSLNIYLFLDDSSNKYVLNASYIPVH